MSCVHMARPVTLRSAQWEDVDFAQLCRAAYDMGYDGVEISVGRHFDPIRAVSDDAYCAILLATLDEHHVGASAIAAHGPGHCLTSVWDPRLAALAPESACGSIDGVQAWAADVLAALPEAAERLGVQIVTGCLGSPVWPFWYDAPAADLDMAQDGLNIVREMWTPILDEFQRRGIQYAAEVSPGQIAFDYYTTQCLLDAFDNVPALGIDYNPAHFVWQGINPVAVLRDMASRIYHVNVTDVAVTLDGRSSLLGSMLPMGNTRRGWNFRAPGHGDVPFEDIIRELNAIDYDGPLSVAWEDAGMDRMLGAAEACAFLRQLEFGPERPLIRPV